MEERRFYVLSTFDEGLPAHVKAIIADDEHEASEKLYVAHINQDGAVEHYAPLVVFDNHNTLRYGVEFLEAVKLTDIETPAVVIRGVSFD